MTKHPTNNSKAQQPIRAVHMGMFPTMGTLQEVIDFSDSKLPSTKNEMVSLLMTYQNTLLKVLNEQKH